MNSQSIALIEADSYLRSAQIIQILGRDSTAQIVKIDTSSSGARTIVLAGSLSDLQYALGLVESLALSSALFPKPTGELRKYLGETEPPAVPESPQQDSELPLFAVSGDASSNGSIPKMNGVARTSNPGGRIMQHTPEGGKSLSSKSLFELQDMAVPELRHYARSLPDFPIAGREISRANKSELLQMFKSTEERRNTERALSAETADGSDQPNQ